ncbi:nucleolar protein 11-like isoform X2 [Tubulanus polymorphus]|uniref:nucleolar protein 11-like isoform X2 n=1 Tax=Tubulanus polymorphus TaxID=672921 RepID=UPI003DA610CD
MKSVPIFNFPGNESSIIGISPANEAKNAIMISQKNQGLTLYDLTDQQLRQSWSIRQGVCITCPSIYCVKTQKYYCIQNNRTIRIFTCDDKHLDKSLKIHTAVHIHNLVTSVYSEPWVVFHDGQISSLADATGIKEIRDQSDGGNIVFAESVDCNGKIYIFVVRCSKLRHLDISLTIEGRGKRKLVTCVLTPPESSMKSDQLTACCLQAQTTGYDLLTLWSSGHLQSTSLCGEVLKTVLRHKIPNITLNTTVAVIDSNHIALMPIQQDGCSGVGIWDCRYGTLQQWSAIPYAIQTKYKIFTMDRYIFVPCGGTIYQCTFSSDALTLNSALGKQSDPEASVESYWAAANKNNKAETYQLEPLTKLLKQIDKETVQPAEFKKILNDVLVLVHNIKQPDAAIASQFHSLWKTCCESKNIWPENLLLELIERKLLPMSSMVDVFDVIVQRKCTQMLITAIGVLKHIPEACIVGSLQFILKNLSNTDISSLVNSIEERKSYLSGDKFKTINTLLTMPFSDVFLVESLRKMSFTEVLLLLRYLHHLLKFGVESYLDFIETKSLTILQIVDWLCLLLDAHFAQLILSTDARSILVELHQITESQPIRKQRLLCDWLSGRDQQVFT